MSQSYQGPIPKYLAANEVYVKDVFPTLPAPWKMADRRGPAHKSGQATLILTCLDPRCIPDAYFGPKLSTGVVRNAGGRATDDAIQSFTILRGLIGVRNVVVVHHTDCGVMHVSPTEVIDYVAQEGSEAKSAAEAMDFRLYGHDELEESVREDVRILRAAPSLAGVNVYGFTLDTFTGKVEPVDV